MNILHTIPGLNIGSGGPTSCTYNLLKTLRNMQVSVDVLALAPKDQSEQIIGTDAFIKTVPNDARTPLVYSRNFKSFLQEHREYDLYHGNALWTYPTHITAVTARRYDKPYVITPHGMLYPQGLAVSPWRKRIAAALFQRRDLADAACLHATCMAELQYIREYGLKTPVAVIPNGLLIDPESAPRQTVNTQRRFGFVGRINRIKNIDLLLVAWHKLGSKTQDSELLIAGDGDPIYKKELEQYIETHHMTNVYFMGFIAGNALTDFIQSLDYLVLPSKSENFGMVVPEALVQGVPVIASCGTPWQDLNTHCCGWWVDLSQLADALNKALTQSESERRVMGEAGRTLVIQKYSIDTLARNMELLYKWLINKDIRPDFIHI